MTKYNRTLSGVQNNDAKRENVVFSTTKYDMFSFLDANRKLNVRNYSKLINSMKEKQLIIPIIVNEKMQIIDGQHRFTAEKELGLPVYYMIQKGYGIEEVKRANMVSSNWTKEDFMLSHIQTGIDEYVEFKEILDTYGINIADAIALFAFVQNKNQTLAGKIFDNGSFSLAGKDKAIEFLEALEDFSFFKEYKSKSFFSAFMKLYFNPDYDHKKMKERLKVRGSYLTKKGSYGEYLEVLTKQIYSFGAVKKPLFFDNSTKRFYTV